jgi:hypothetical protein
MAIGLLLSRETSLPATLGKSQYGLEVQGVWVCKLTVMFLVGGVSHGVTGLARRCHRWRCPGAQVKVRGRRTEVGDEESRRTALGICLDAQARLTNSVNVDNLAHAAIGQSIT